jgi:hypothetical protein
MSKILYTSGEVRKAIAKLFSESEGDRVAISAFVGEGADIFLPKPKGLKLICWPKAGGTNPNTLRKLVQSKVKVYFSDSVHMKVNWTKDLGAVITSANLSQNALGSGNLREIGVQLRPGAVDIERVIASIKPHHATKRELLRLDRQHKLFAARNPGYQKKSKADSWAEWYGSKWKSEWKLGWWDEVATVSRTAKEYAKREYGISDPHDFIAGKKGNFVRGDWVLTFFLRKQSPAKIKWLYVDYCIRVPKSERRSYDPVYPYQAVQVASAGKYPVPPFQIDKRFREALVRTVREVGAEKIKNWKSVKPSQNFLGAIHKHYK